MPSQVSLTLPGEVQMSNPFLLLSSRGKRKENVRWSRCCRMCVVLVVFLVCCAFLALNYIRVDRWYVIQKGWPQWIQQQVGQNTNVDPPVIVPTVSSSLGTIHGPYDIAYPHKYQFILDEPEKCKGQSPFLVLIVPIEPYDRTARDIIRRTWGNESAVPGVYISRLFLLGLPEQPESLQEKLHAESREHHDLLQSDFQDSYLNLTIKTMMMMEWLVSRCPNAIYAAKVDKDMFFNMDFMVNKLLEPHKAEPKQNYITGAVIYGGIVHRDRGSKWYVPEEVFAQATYPCYVSGNAYIFSMDLPRKILLASLKVKPFHLEDVYLGMCLENLHILPTEPPMPDLFQLWWLPYDRCLFSRIISVTGVHLNELERYWADLHTPAPNCS